MNRIIREMLPLLMMPLAVSAAPDFGKHLLFKLDFEKGSKAEVAQGKAQGKFQGSGSPKFVEGRRGRGFLTGGNKEALQYPCTGNLNGECGTLVFWQKKLQNVEFNTNDKNHHVFVAVEGKNRSTLIYKYGECFLPWVLELYKNGTQDLNLTLLFPNESTYDKLAWHQYIYTWDGCKAAFYMDGQLCSSQVREVPFEKTTAQDSFCFGQNSNFGSRCDSNRIMDDIAIYDRALNDTEIYALYRSELDDVPAPEITVVPTETPLTLDGEFSEPIYRKAAAMPILYNADTRNLAEVPSVVYFTYDNENFYVSLKAPIGSKAFEKAHTALLKGMFLAERKTFDMDIDNDDSFIIDIMRDGMYYYLAANTIDVRYDYSVEIAKTLISLNWNPAWQVGSRITAEGWQIECAIPRKEIRIDGAVPLKFKANFMRRWRMLKTATDSLAQYDSAPHVCFNKTPKRYAEITLNADTVSVGMNDIARFDRNGVIFKATVSNSSKSGQKVIAELFSGRNVLDTKTLTVPAGGSVLCEYNSRFEKQQNSLGFRVRSGDRKKCYFSFENPVYSFENIQLNVVTLPSSDTLELNGSFAQMNLDLGTAAVEIAVSRAGTTVLSKSLKLTQKSFRYAFSTKEWQPGDYDIEVSIKENGKTVASRKAGYSQKAMPEWVGNNIGLTDKVPRPWVPMQVDGGKITTLNTVYDFRDNPFPTSIIAAGKELLRAPVAMRLATDQGEAVVKVANKVLRSKDGEVVLCGSGAAAGVSVNVKTTVEFDGYMWHELTLTPEKGTVTIKSLQIDIPLKPECAELIVPYDYTLATTGKLTNWHSTNTPLWVGNAERGLAFLAEHIHNWSLDNTYNALEAKSGAEGCIHLNLANKKFQLAKAETYEFSLQATPAKPVNRDYRKLRFVAYDDIKESFADEHGSDFILWWAVSWGRVHWDSGEVCYPFVGSGYAPDSFRKRFNDNNVHLTPYYQLHTTWSDSPEYKRFGYEWISESSLPVIQEEKSNNRYATVCQNSRSFQDFSLFYLEKCIKEYNWRGMYFDMSQPHTCINIHHGCGYVRDGQVLPTTNYRGARQLVKRIYCVLSEINEYPMIVYHNSGQICPQIHGFAGAFVDGENFNSRLKDNRGYEEVLRPDVFRAEYMGHNFGVQGAMLAEFRISDALRKAMETKKFNDATRAEWEELAGHQNYLLGLALLHDSQITTGYLFHRETMFNAFQILRDMHYSTGELKFIPYWNQTVTPLDEKQGIVSFYVGKDFAVAVLMNTGSAKADFRLPLDRKALGVPFRSVANMYYPEAVSLNGDVLEIRDVPPKQYRAVMLK